MNEEERKKEYRQWLAGMAMAAQISRGEQLRPSELARRAFEYTDAFLKEEARLDD